MMIKNRGFGRKVVYSFSIEFFFMISCRDGKSFEGEIFVECLVFT